MANETLGASFSIDVTNLKAGLAQANRMIRESESEFRSAAAGLDDWSSSEQGVTARIKNLNNVTDIQRKKVDALQQEYDRLIADGLDPASRQAIELRTQINNETTALNKNEKELQQQTQALNDMANGSKKAADATEETGKSFDGLKKAGAVAVGAVAAVGAACVAAVGSFLALAESTRHARTQMAKLETGFTEAGLTAEDATNTFTELYGVLGDEDKATEAAAFLGQMADSETELIEMTHTLTGVYATFGDALPVEGLAEAINHTANLGTVQGNLADALEWSGVNVDDFNAQLAACSDEEERQALIMSTLSGIYDGAATTYKEVNADVIAAQEAQAGMNQALNDLGAIAEPIMTTLKTLATDLLIAITPFVSLIGEGLKGSLEGAAGSTDLLAEGLSGILNSLVEKITQILPTILSVIVQVVPGIVSSLIGQLPTLMQMVIDIVIQIVNTLTETLPQIITAIMAVLPLLINQLIAAVPQLLQAAITLLMSLIDALPTIITALIAALPSVINTILNAVLQAYPMLIDAAIQLMMALIDALPVIINALIVALPDVISAITNALIHAIPLLINASIKMFGALIQAIPKFLPQLIKSIPQIITSIVSGLVDGISDIEGVGKDIVEGLWNGIKSMGDWIGGKIKGFGEDVLGGIKDFFGIHSPSKVMADQVGKNLALGIGKGFEENIAGVNDEITGAMNFEDANGNGRKVGGVTVYQTNNYSQAHSRYELYKSRQQTAAAVRLAVEV